MWCGEQGAGVVGGGWSVVGGGRWAVGGEWLAVCGGRWAVGGVVSGVVGGVVVHVGLRLGAKFCWLRIELK